jgi:acetylornithine/N-succinyldiaminopimelate aminotransferase
MTINHGYIVNSHARNQTQFTHGKGVNLYTKNDEYLDFMAGVAVNSLGHCNEIMINALNEQAHKMWHISNVFYNKEMDDCAQTLCNVTGMENVFFCNSGSEAVEGAIKMARKYFQDQGQYKYEIITCKGSFHGRSITNISAAGEEAYLKGFYPALEGFKHIEYGNIEEVRGAINEHTAGILVEPIQGEGGLKFAGWNYLKELSNLAKEKGILLLLDEVQCGAGRTGKFSGFHWAEIQPDIIALAKGIGGGFPVGATLFAKSTKNVITIGSHGTTFGGNPLAMAVTNAVSTEISKPEFLKNVQVQSQNINEMLNNLMQKFPHIIKEIRGFGLMTGFMLHEEFAVKNFADKVFENKLLTMPARNNVLRLLPPLIIQESHVAQAGEILERTLNELPVKELKS